MFLQQEGGKYSGDDGPSGAGEYRGETTGDGDSGEWDRQREGEDAECSPPQARRQYRWTAISSSATIIFHVSE